MSLAKKDQTVTIRLPEKTKILVQELADQNFRTFQDQVLLLITKALNVEHYNPKDWQ